MIHICPLDKTCRQFDPPWRLNLRVPGWFVSIALRSQDRFGGKVDMDEFDTTGKVVMLGASRWVEIRRS